MQDTNDLEDIQKYNSIFEQELEKKKEEDEEIDIHKDEKVKIVKNIRKLRRNNKTLTAKKRIASSIQKGKDELKNLNKKS